MSDIGIIGQKDLVAALGALGIAGYHASNSQEARDALLQAEKDKIKIVFIFEKLAKPIMDFLVEKTEPVVVLIPDHMGSTGLASGLIKRAMAKAIGTEEISR